MAKKAMSKKHYHVLGGLHGYMPDVNSVYLLKSDARQGLLFWKKDEIEMSYQVEDRSDFSISGNLKIGYYEVVNGGNEYYQITECSESDCLIDYD